MLLGTVSLSDLENIYIAYIHLLYLAHLASTHNDTSLVLIKPAIKGLQGNIIIYITLIGNTTPNYVAMHNTFEHDCMFKYKVHFWFRKIFSKL